MQDKIEFEELWNVIEKARNARNSVTYHPCCYSWSTRKSRSSRASHLKSLNWSFIRAQFDKQVPNEKAALLTYLKDRGLDKYIYLNLKCRKPPHVPRNSSNSDSSRSENKPKSPLLNTENPIDEGLSKIDTTKLPLSCISLPNLQSVQILRIPNRRFLPLLGRHACLHKNRNLLL